MMQRAVKRAAGDVGARLLCFFTLYAPRGMLQFAVAIRSETHVATTTNIVFGPRTVIVAVKSSVPTFRGSRCQLQLPFGHLSG